ncbi:tetratricopeptide repeat protein [Sphingomonas daechungensis]|uniref:tetratricopeptide repeat protein n=1 Tax=Sphingomonas daechungensis TaxID=1176646 RepID=UPI00378516E7
MRVAFMVGLTAALLAVAAPAQSGPPNYEMSEENRAASDAMERGDMANAVPAFLAAATKGDSGAQLVLGGLYQWGQGVPRDYALARRYLTSAADAGWGEAMNNLGVMAWEGQGEPPDRIEALKWLLLSVRYMTASHDEESTPIAMPHGNLKKYRAKMTADEIAEAERRASAWRPTDPAAAR